MGAKILTADKPTRKICYCIIVFFLFFFFTSATLPVLMYCSFHSPLANPVKECCSQSNHVCKINLFSQDYRRHFADLGLIWSFVMRVIESKMTKQILLRP